MKNLKSLSALFILSVAFTFGACSQDETMDEIIDNTEINSPSPMNNGGSTNESQDGPT